MRSLRQPLMAFAMLAMPSAALADGTYTVIGAPGLVPCTQWLEISDNDTLRVLGNDDVAEEQVKAWVAGFLSAYNRYALGAGNVAEGRTAEDLLAWADRFCEANPEASMAMLAETMIHVLENGSE
ncbi:MAG: hypothetical protein AAFP17_05650 [Pseudomonadota bacterium]